MDAGDGRDGPKSAVARCGRTMILEVARANGTNIDVRRITGCWALDPRREREIWGWRDDVLGSQPSDFPSEVAP